MKNLKTLLFIIAIIVTVLLIIVGPGVQKKQEAKRINGAITLSDTDYVYGSPNAPVTIVEYSDIECPYCKNTHPVLKAMVDKSEGKVNWVYKHFPLTSIHAKALPLALVTECAGKMKGNDAFWKVLNSLMADGDENKALALVGLNKGVIASCVQDPATMAIIKAHMEQAKNLKVEGTPYIVIKGPKSSKKIPGMPDEVQLESVIANMLIE